ncbi:hypothetical protein CBOM_06035 [Ceraceosorus bombacis]|uniref:Uncharacterized protein n=1 Tax=Ceraceosorus bombacis TaxID=401625 RepID=A0A0P1BJR9_9BASI|nr:hypothetical protein CBOM_06035 [Ceraceosorus bombacis]
MHLTTSSVADAWPTSTSALASHAINASRRLHPLPHPSHLRIAPRIYSLHVPTSSAPCSATIPAPSLASLTGPALCTGLAPRLAQRLYSTATPNPKPAASPAPPQYGLAAVRAAPFKHALALVVLHVGISQVLLLPAYWAVHSAGLGNSMLAGPQAAWILSRPLPAWMANAVGLGSAPSKSPALTEEGQEIQSKQEIMRRRLERRGRRATVEDLLELEVGKLASGAWGAGGGLIRLISDFRASAQGPSGTGTDQESQRAMDELKGRGGGGDGAGDGAGAKSWGTALGGSISTQARGIAGNIRITQVRDAFAAWVVDATPGEATFVTLLDAAIRQRSG